MIRTIKQLLSSLFVLIILVYYPDAWAEPSPNLTLYKVHLLCYHDSGQYNQEISVVTQRAMTYLKQRVQENKHAAIQNKLAIVVDIDETALSNFKFLRALDFAFLPKTVSSQLQSAQDDVILPTRTLYQEALKNHVAIFFITGRPENLRSATITNLHRAGYATWAGLKLRPDNFHLASMSIYKTAERKKISNAGYDIILNIGDQQSDLIGGYADKTFKLPNPFYFIR